MTPHVTSAVQAAAKEIVGDLDAYAKAFQLDWPPNRDSYALAVSDIILRHVEPIVRAVEGERDHLLGKFREMEGNAIMERCRADRAEAKLAAVEGERDALKAERDEGMAVLADIGPITCRNGVQHLHHDGCLYCERDQALAKLAAVEGELRAERSTCMGTLCAMCTKKPADSHDGCRLRAAEALRESLESAERRAIGAAEHEKHWRKVAEAEVERLKRKELTMSNELVAYERESFGQSLAKELAKVMEERDQALAKLATVELSAREMEDAARSYRDRMNSALARAEQSEALLREALEAVRKHSWGLVGEPVEDERAVLIDKLVAHLAPKANP